MSGFGRRVFDGSARAVLHAGSRGSRRFAMVLRGGSPRCPDSGSSRRSPSSRTRRPENPVENLRENRVIGTMPPCAPPLLPRSLSGPGPGVAQSANPLSPQIDRLTQELTPQVVTWRRDFHQHPELGNREQRTSKIIAEELKRLGYEVTDRRGAHRRRGGAARRQAGTRRGPALRHGCAAGHRAGAICRSSPR